MQNWYDIYKTKEFQKFLDDLYVFGNKLISDFWFNVDPNCTHQIILAFHYYDRYY